MQTGLKHTSSSTSSGCKQMCENSHRPALENTSYFHSQSLSITSPLLKTRPFSHFHAFQPCLRHFVLLTIQTTSLNLFPSFTSNQLPPSRLSSIYFAWHLSLFEVYAQAPCSAKHSVSKMI